MGAASKVPLCLYNFGDKAAHGELKITGPKDWDVQMESNTAEVAPGERHPLPDLTIDPKTAPEGTIGTVRFDGDFGDAGKVVLSVRFIVQPKGPGDGY